PVDVCKYLWEDWLSEQFLLMWSACWCTNRHVYDESETNMLIEAWHHVLKTHFLHSKQNQRINYLLSILTEDVLPHYKLKKACQQDHFKGEDAEGVERCKVKEK
ncbi:hypothetical protein C8J56DRAFT_721807, partial [Mycena floridula]